MSLGYAKIGQIEDKADGVLQDVFETLPFTTPPVNLEEIAKFFGISIREGTFHNDSVLGLYKRDAKLIFVASSSSKSRKRFTIAHELGHFFLHRDMKQEIFNRKKLASISNGPLSSTEQEANWFAAGLLMPREATRLYWQDTKDIGDFASIFRVSNSAAAFRLKNLSLVE